MKADAKTEAEVKAALDRVFEAFVDGDVDAWFDGVVPEGDLAWIGTGPEEFAVGRANDSHDDRGEPRGDIAPHGRAFVGDGLGGGRRGVDHGRGGDRRAAGGRDISLPFRLTGVFVKREGRWLIANVHQSVGDARQLGPTWDTMMDTIASDVCREQPELMRQAAPDGMVTLLFSDIEESTEMTERLGDIRWMQVLREHNAIVRERVAAHNGFEVKTIGDAFMVAFQSARRALLCAMDIQRAFSAYSREQPDQALRLRAGLHAGEPIREADDFYGKSVILASRIAGQAQGGEILVSSLLKELAESAGDIAFGEPREAKLKGFAGTHAMFPVLWESVA